MNRLEMNRIERSPAFVQIHAESCRRGMERYPFHPVTFQSDTERSYQVNMADETRRDEAAQGRLQRISPVQNQ